MGESIFWDFDGTLVYKNQSFLQALCGAIKEKHYDIEEVSCAEHLHKTCTWNQPEESYVQCVGEDWWKVLLCKTKEFLVLHDVSADDSEVIVHRFREKVIQYPYILYEDAKEILGYTKNKGYKNYLISNNFPELVNTIREFDLAEYFEDYFLSSNIGYEKPRIELFQYALEKAGKPMIAYMVGDHPIADMKGAKGAGMHTIFVHPGCQCEDAEYVCNTLLEIKNYL